MFEQMFDKARVAVTSTPIGTRASQGSTDGRQVLPEVLVREGREAVAMRQYDDPVEVRRGETDGPEQFLWRGRLWKVRAVLAHWVETGPWWQSAGVRAVVGTGEGEPPIHTDVMVERELWRVEAGRGADNAGVFDLSFSWSDGCWQLVGCLD